MSNMTKAFKAKGLKAAQHYCGGTPMVKHYNMGTEEVMPEQEVQEFAGGSSYVRHKFSDNTFTAPNTKTQHDQRYNPLNAANVLRLANPIHPPSAAQLGQASINPASQGLGRNGKGASGFEPIIPVRGAPRRPWAQRTTGYVSGGNPYAGGYGANYSPNGEGAVDPVTIPGTPEYSKAYAALNTRPPIVNAGAPNAPVAKPVVDTARASYTPEQLKMDDALKAYQDSGKSLPGAGNESAADFAQRTINVANASVRRNGGVMDSQQGSIRHLDNAIAAAPTPSNARAPSYPLPATQGAVREYGDLKAATRDLPPSLPGPTGSSYSAPLPAPTSQGAVREYETQRTMAGSQPPAQPTPSALPSLPPPQSAPPIQPSEPYRAVRLPETQSVSPAAGDARMMNGPYAGKIEATNPANTITPPTRAPNSPMDKEQYKKGTTRVPGKNMGKDTVPAMLTPGEAVLTPGAAQALGRGTIAKLNKANPPKGGAQRKRGLHHYAAGTEEVEERPLITPTLGDEIPVMSGPILQGPAVNVANRITDARFPVEAAAREVAKAEAAAAAKAAAAAPAAAPVPPPAAPPVTPAAGPAAPAPGRITQTIADLKGAASTAYDAGKNGLNRAVGAAGRVFLGPESMPGIDPNAKNVRSGVSNENRAFADAKAATAAAEEAERVKAAAAKAGAAPAAAPTVAEVVRQEAKNAAKGSVAGPVNLVKGGVTLAKDLAGGLIDPTQRLATRALKVAGPANLIYNASRVGHDAMSGGPSSYLDVGNQILRDGVKLVGSTLVGSGVTAGTALTGALPVAPAAGIAAGIGTHYGLEKLEQAAFGDSPVNKIHKRNEIEAAAAAEKAKGLDLAQKTVANAGGAASIAASDRRVQEAAMSQGEWQRPVPGKAAPTVADGAAAAAATSAEVAKDLDKTGGETAETTKPKGLGAVLNELRAESDALWKIANTHPDWGTRQNAANQAKAMSGSIQHAISGLAATEGHRLTAESTAATRAATAQKDLMAEERARSEDSDKLYNQYTMKGDPSKYDLDQNSKLKRRVELKLGDMTKDFYLLPITQQRAFVSKMRLRNDVLDRVNAEAANNYGAKQSDDLDYGITEQKGGNWWEETFGSKDNRISGRGLWDQARRLLPGDQSTVIIGGNAMGKDKVFGSQKNQSEMAEVAEIREQILSNREARKQGKKAAAKSAKRGDL